ncbi:GGDEF domain-containing protein [Sphingomonas sp. BIUV-7]|uniref:diguanylate cyclase n=1 Tax=Sphingomonas natans TaxID=3063330 RepID=A0ABT8YAL6_9SPHN|nr:GGDEF domain-containing protein [Sphingomonas sp. BIUV-7]MDO6414883.1 GGDEF domain-containing protein [Sphingomonas sp. BIUV-7]
MHHDPRLGAALRAAKLPDGPGWMARLRHRLGFGAKAAAPVEVEGILPPADDEALLTLMAPSPGVEALTRLLEELIVSAQMRIDGAVLLVGRSADEAEAYREALATEAEALIGSTLGDQVTAALVGVTRNMVARARGAEEKLRSMGAELETVQRDLAEARQSAERDQLTGLPNRRALEAALLRAVEGTRAADQALSLAFCDIDHFKRLNDTHGHALGDRVLRLVGDCLTDGAGADAFVGRQGGEEFVMLFEGVPLDEAAARVDAIRAELATRDFKSRTNETPIGRITFSAGVAQLRPDEQGDGLLHRADEALYRAKDKGRNRIELDRG